MSVTKEGLEALVDANRPRPEWQITSKVLKKQKIYFRDQQGSSRRLDKAAPLLYVFVLNYFMRKGGNEKYNDLNKDVKSWRDYKAISLKMTPELKKDIRKLQPKGDFNLFVNGTWRPLIAFY